MGIDSRSKQKHNDGKSKSQRRLALAILLVLLTGLAVFFMSDYPAASDLRGKLLSQLGITSEEEDAAEPEDTEPAGQTGGDTSKPASDGNVANLDSNALPEYNGNYYVTVNGSVPEFPEDVYTRAGIVSTDGKRTTEGSKAGKIDQRLLVPYEYYGELDNLGRCTAAYGCLGEETMPDDGTERGDISGIHPSGWAKAQNWERCHLIAWALSDENANERNLVTGTHYMNHDGMRPLEEEVEHYIWNTGNHVLYMSKPVFYKDELVPRGVQMVAWSCEDQGKGISFNVYCFNVTPGAEINYSNGVVTTAEQAAQDERLYVVNTRSGVFHYPSCDGAKSIYKKNRMEVTCTRKELTDQGYIPCGYCEP